ncbi:hypothetical protein EV175_003914 [Coemansia sp. RSA 1933]|nr:hypothetical protein EV175_003914 [Coemansia sp. RSA 1933]
MKVDNESLYGSSIYRGNQSVDDADLPEYMQLCRRLFPELMSKESDYAGLEAEENLAKYLKYLTGLPLPSLKIEPTLLQNDLQRISNELTMLLLNETTKRQSSSSNNNSSSGVRRSESAETHQLARQIDSSEAESGDGDMRIFSVVYETGKAAALATESIGASLGEAQEALLRLERACESFSAEMAQLDQRTKVVQRVLDKQDIITRIVELPRVMRMCVAGGYYEEAVEIAEHVRVTGDRLVRDIRDGVGTLPGSLGGSDGTAVVTAASKEQLIGFVGSIQRQVHAEFEHMVVDLCRELGYTRLATSSSAQGSGKRQTANSSPDAGSLRIGDPGGEGSDDGYERSIKRLSQVAKIVAILRSVGMFTEPELRLLYLRSRWQAWLQTAETLSGFAPAVVFASAEDLLLDSADTQNDTSAGASDIMSVSPDMSRLSRIPEKNGTSSAEVSAYLEKLIHAYLSWIAEADIHYRTLFSRNQSSESSDAANDLATDPLTDLATFSARRFLPNTLPILDLLADASGIASLQQLVSTHARRLSQSNVDFVTPFLEQRLGERAFASIACGVEEAAAESCRKLADLRASALGLSSKGSKNRRASVGAEKASLEWEQLAVSTRPPLALPPDGFNTSLVGSPSMFLGQYRISPVGLLQYPLLAQLLHAFRDSLHTLRILVLAGDSSRAKKDSGAEVLTLLTMASIVLESELARIAVALAGLCASVLGGSADSGDSAKQLTRDIARHACVAFVFGLARSVAEIFEEVASLSEAASAAGLCSEGDDGNESAVTLYSQAVYKPLLSYLP